MWYKNLLVEIEKNIFTKEKFTYFPNFYLIWENNIFFLLYKSNKERLIRIISIIIKIQFL